MGTAARTADQPQWLACLDYLRFGDTLVLVPSTGSPAPGSWPLSPCTTSDAAVSIRSLTESALNVDITSPIGQASSTS